MKITPPDDDESGRDNLAALVESMHSVCETNPVINGMRKFRRTVVLFRLFAIRTRHCKAFASKYNTYFAANAMSDDWRSVQFCCT